MVSRRALVSAFGAALLLCAGRADAGDAQPADKPPVHLFNIPAQPLRTALISYAAIVDLQIMYDAAQTAKLRSRPVVGLFTADTALRVLIAGTDLTVVPTGRDIALVPTAVIQAGRIAGAAPDGESTLVLDTLYVSAPPGAGQNPDYGAYGQFVRGLIRKALTYDPRTARRVYDAQIDIWVGPEGAISATRVTRSSGAAPFDAVLCKVIEDIILDRPPPVGMRQPIHVTVIGV